LEEAEAEIKEQVKTKEREKPSDKEMA